MCSAMFNAKGGSSVCCVLGIVGVVYGHVAYLTSIQDTGVCVQLQTENKLWAQIFPCLNVFLVCSIVVLVATNAALHILTMVYLP